MICGLASRSNRFPLPDVVVRYAGDILWGWLVFLIVGLLGPRKSTVQVAVFAYLIAVAIEISQLYHAPWIDSLRQTNLGALVLGFGFLWSDLACYAIGILFGMLLEIAADLRKRTAQSRDNS
jgi:hypothetical protein